MQVKNCRRCKRLFNYIMGEQLCPACREEMEKKFQEVKNYIRENTGATIKDIIENIDVPELQVRQWIKEERLVFTNASLAGIVCETCGKPITTGRFCEKCKNETVNAFNTAFNIKSNTTVTVDKGKASPKMRFLDNK